ncbi:hypothetical protein O181_053532 [Austropuccinia psidii MF-1]|uniref:Uncharacterized protein n=1 Tax=Austropuccinia psidii MF-1 TaxID=1389203 RepID=A0A9Q3E529_9BASI|nr:hypothetical protein [Austropuccinia psidii MF-1]
MLADKHIRKVRSLSAPSDHAAREVLTQDALARTPLWSTMIKPYLSTNGHQEQFRTISPNKTPRQDSPVPSLPHEQTLRQPTPGPSGTQWSEELFREPSQTKEPPIPGPSPSSQPPEDDTTPQPEPEDNTTPQPEPEVPPMQSTEEPFACPATPHSKIIIDDMPVGSSLPLPHLPILFPRFPPSSPENPNTSSSLVQSPSHSHYEARQEFTNLRPTLMIPQAIVHESIN